MGRPNKQGLEYFSFDVDFFEDDKIQLVSAEYGTKGEIIVIRLLCLIYRNGYYYKWGEDESLLLAKRVGNGITGSLVSDVVKGLVKRSFFDERVFNSFQILTSRGIQKRYLEAVVKRDKVLIDPRILLIDVSGRRNVVYSGINGIDSASNTQSKVKESKYIERENAREQDSENGSSKNYDSSPESSVPDLPTLQDVVNYAISSGVDEEVGHRFWNKYESQGWVNGNGIKIKNWKPKFNEWVMRQPQFEQTQKEKYGNGKSSARDGSTNRSSVAARTSYQFDQQRFNQRGKLLESLELGSGG